MDGSAVAYGVDAAATSERGSMPLSDAGPEGRPVPQMESECVHLSDAGPDTPDDGSTSTDVEPANFDDVNELVGKVPGIRECDGQFLELWIRRGAEVAESGGSSFPGDPTSCYECLEQARTACPELPGNCLSPGSCVERNCLCSAEVPVSGELCSASDYPSNVCACATACFSLDDDVCPSAWNGRFECLSDACLDVCREHQSGSSP